MRILVINADCIERNSSANLCHLAYIRGMIDSGHEVVVLSADGRDYKLDQNMRLPQNVENHTFYGVSLYEKISLIKNVEIDKKKSRNSINSEKKSVTEKKSCKKSLKQYLLGLYGPHGIYSTFVRKAFKYSDVRKFDYVISLSTPPASHLLAEKLLKAKKIQADKWIQIWEDPWYSDAYGFNGNENIHKEEKRLLSIADRICYVSPLTLQNQKKLYPESATKMYWQPLPYYYKGSLTNILKNKKNIYGYFGDYVPAARNLKPFYDAAVKANVEVNICGNPNNLFASTNLVTIYPRLSLAELKPIEDKTNVLIFLCNRKGGQIPGKIYQYSATNKVILFILDGDEEEKKVIKDYFMPFDRYIFCENTEEDIGRAISLIENGLWGKVKNEPVEDFNPRITIEKILKGI